MDFVSGKRIPAMLAAAALVLATAACVSVPTMSRHSIYSQNSYSLKPIGYRLRWSLLDYAIDPKGGKSVGGLGSDQTVGTSGFLGQNVNEVVPIPGTDMIRVGALQEGSLSQNQFRSPTQDGLGAGGSGGGLFNGATLIFKIHRP